MDKELKRLKKLRVDAAGLAWQITEASLYHKNAKKFVAKPGSLWRINTSGAGYEIFTYLGPSVSPLYGRFLSSNTCKEVVLYGLSLRPLARPQNANQEDENI